MCSFTDRDSYSNGICQDNGDCGVVSSSHGHVVSVIFRFDFVCLPSVLAFDAGCVVNDEGGLCGVDRRCYDGTCSDIECKTDADVRDACACVCV